MEEYLGCERYETRLSKEKLIDLLIGEDQVKEAMEVAKEFYWKLGEKAGY